MLRKTLVRLLILILFVASAVLVTISTRTEAFHLSSLSLSTSCSTGNTVFGNKVYAKAKITYIHPLIIDSMAGPHWHSFTYNAYASVGYKVDRNPAEGGSATETVNSWTRFYSPKTIRAYVTSADHDLSDAYASAAASENSDNWDFCPKP